MRERGDVVRRAVVERSGKREHSVGSERQRLAAVVAQHEPAALETRDCAADRVAALDAYVRHVAAADVAAGVRYGASLSRGRWIREHHDGVWGAARNGCSESERAVCADRDTVA